jgi:non-homologous end joining protein Ku
MVAIADAIIKQRTGKFDPGANRDRYQEALRSSEREGLDWRP